MTTLQASETQNTEGFWLSGDYKYKDNETFLQDAARAAVLAQFTVVARQQSDLKLVPLTDLNPALTSAKMVCGAIGGTAAEFAALSDAEFAISADGTLINITGLDLTGLDTVLDTAGYMTAGAIGGTLPEFQAVGDGQFGIGIDGNTAIQVGGLDFSGLDTETDVPGSLQCGANGANLGAWQAVGDGAFNVTVNGLVINITGLVFTSIVDLSDVAAVINQAALGRFTALYNHTGDTYSIVSNTTGETSIVSVLSAPGAGTDISGAGFLDGQTGAGGGVSTPGTGGEGTAQTIQDIINAAALGRFFCYFNGNAFVFISPTKGEVSAVTDLTAGTAGTDISGAAFLNGLAGVNVAGTGGEGLFETISGIINAQAAGRFLCHFDGDAFVFYSLKEGLPASVITVLTAVVAGAGTDISGAAYLNGLTGTGTATAATGEATTAIPIGIFIGGAILAADLVAGDVTDQIVSGYGDPATFDVNKLVLENSLDIDDVVVGTGQTIRQHLTNIGLIASETDEIFQSNPLT